MEKILELFRDGCLTKKELNFHLIKNKKIKAVTITAEHVIHILTLYKHNHIKKDYLIDWINIIWFSDYFIYEPSQKDSIASVINKLEEFEDSNESIPYEIIDNSIITLKNNYVLE